MKFARTLFAELNKNSVSYCHFKSNQHLEEGLLGITDLDILVSSTDKKGFERTLKQHGGHKVHTPTWASYRDVDDWIVYNSHTDRTLHIHTHYTLVLGKKFVKETNLNIDTHILHNSILDKTGVYIATPADELIMLIVRICIKTTVLNIFAGIFNSKKLLPDNMHDELEYLYTQTTAEEIKAASIQLLEKIPTEKIVARIESVRNSRTVFLMIHLKFFWLLHGYTYRTKNIFSVYGAYFIKSFRSKISSKLNKTGFNLRITKKTVSHSQPGLIIAIVGADGAGKSTLNTTIYNWLSWKIAVSNIYLGRHWLFLKLEALKKSIMGTSSKKTSTGKKQESKHPLKILTSDIRKLLNVSRRHTQLKKAVGLKEKGFIVLTDRFPQNQICGLNDGPSIAITDKSPFWRKFIHVYEKRMYDAMAQTQPDILIKLMVTENIALARKPDHNKEQIQKKIEIIKELNFNAKKIYEIDTTQRNANEVARQVKSLIWKRIQEYEN